MERTLGIAILCFALQVAAIKKEYLSIAEHGINFKEKIYVDDTNRFEVIEVPDHGELKAIKVLSDFKKGYSIYRVPASQACLVVNIDPSEERPDELLASAKATHHKIPTNNTIEITDNFLPTGIVNRNASVWKTASYFCGKDYEVQYAIIIKGKNVTELALQMLSKASQGDQLSKRAVEIRGFFTCGQGSNRQSPVNAMVEFNLCSGRLPHVMARCSSHLSCIYLVQCPWEGGNVQAWLCNGRHRFHKSAVCCSYKCQPPASQLMNVLDVCKFAAVSHRLRAMQEIIKCSGSLHAMKVTCSWKFNIHGRWTTVSRQCPYSNGKFACQGVDAHATRGMVSCTYACTKVKG